MFDKIINSRVTQVVICLLMAIGTVSSVVEGEYMLALFKATSLFFFIVILSYQDLMSKVWALFDEMKDSYDESYRSVYLLGRLDERAGTNIRFEEE